MINVESGAKLDSVLVVPIFSPFDTNKLLDSPEDSYGDPTAMIDLGERAWGYEYVGSHGRVRSCEQSYEDETGWVTDRWIELYPGKLYLEDVVRPKYLDEIQIKEAQWNILVMPSDRIWSLMLTMDGRAITRVHYSRK